MSKNSNWRFYSQIHNKSIELDYLPFGEFFEWVIGRQVYDQDKQDFDYKTIFDTVFIRSVQQKKAKLFGCRVVLLKDAGGAPVWSTVYDSPVLVTKDGVKKFVYCQKKSEFIAIPKKHT